MSTLGKQQSVSTSNIATSGNVAMSTMTALQMQSTQMNVQNKVSTITGPATNIYTTTAQQHQQQQYHQHQQQQQHQSLSSPSSPTLINTTSPTSMQQQQQHQLTTQQQKQLNQNQQQQQQQKHIQTQHLHLQQQPHKSPKKSTSLPAPVAPSMLSSPPASKVSLICNSILLGYSYRCFYYSLLLCRC